MGKIELKIEIDADLLAKGQAARLDMARTLEDGIRQATLAQNDEDKARRWAEENAEALKAQRERIDAHGVFGEDLRTW